MIELKSYEESIYKEAQELGKGLVIDKIEKVIKRLENYPTDMSCYLKVEESRAATHIKNRFIEILKEELL